MSEPLLYAECEGAVALVHGYLATSPDEAWVRRGQPKGSSPRQDPSR